MRFYAAEPGFFSDQEIHLLQELVDDLSFGLELREKDSLPPSPTR
jgi:hypothetical protein